MSVEEAKHRLRASSDLGLDVDASSGAVAALVEVARRYPLRTAAVVLAVGIGIGFSRPTRRAALSAVRKALGPGA